MEEKKAMRGFAERVGYTEGEINQCYNYTRKSAAKI